MARTTGLFQALVALPTMFFMGEVSMVALFQSRIPIYDFIASTFNALFAAGIIFIVFVQRNVTMSKTITVYFEEAKSGLATAVWLWLLLDTICGPEHHYWYYYSGPRGARIIRAAISIILLFIIYYPTLIYAVYEKRNESITPPQDPEAPVDQGQGERQPLLS
ncbi:uncharacterized protein LY89DRAFT_687722 [Mollisia scopiformis]|uniref:MARVEL domain-containing protein n=1 Tax=Mollisia scopiformis TaxID=149040 RepID=A0A194WXV7_MOLSC|nr:uncharacterized protein LY89DRAFT_687722 [Mollisia scopiformis]KUJ12765.1 hypothetical protein LY89DRAFT_687722 [Mollisia scopiformis]